MLIINMSDNMSGSSVENKTLTADDARQELERINQDKNWTEKQTKALILHNGLYYYYSESDGIFERSEDREHAFHGLMPNNAPPCGLQIYDITSKEATAEKYQTDQYLYLPSSKILYFYDKKKDKVIPIEGTYDIKWLFPFLHTSEKKLPIKQLDTQQLANITYLTSHSQNHFSIAQKHHEHYIETTFHNQRIDKGISRKSWIIGAIGFGLGVVIGAILAPLLVSTLPWWAAAVYGLCILGIVGFGLFKLVSWSVGKFSAWYNDEYKDTKLRREPTIEQESLNPSNQNRDTLNKEKEPDGQFAFQLLNTNPNYVTRPGSTAEELDTAVNLKS